MEIGKYDVREVANWFLHKEAMDQKKLQKICYYAYAWYLYLNNDIEEGIHERLFRNDIEGWVHGPVSRSLYSAFPYTGMTLLKPLKNSGTVPADDFDTVKFLEKIYNVFGKYTGNELESMTHHEYPWIASRRGLKSYDPGNVIISDNLMYNYCAEMSNDETQKDD